MGRPDRKIPPEARALGLNLARIRRQRGLTQVEVARQLGMPQPMVSEYERGVLRLHGQLILKLTRVLGVSADELLGIKERENDLGAVDQRFLRRLRKLQRLPRRDQDAVLRTIDAFLGKAS